MVAYPETHALLKHILHVWDQFRQDSGLRHEEVFISHLHLRASVDNALIDLDRMSEFHLAIGGDGSKRALPDRHKYAGFVAKWIAKVRPIQIRSQLPINLSNARILEVNAVFAVHVMSSFLEHMVPRIIAGHLKYWLVFRDERGETMAMMAYCSEQIAMQFFGEYTTGLPVAK